MPESEIKARYQALHSKLTDDYYNKHLLSEADFQHQHLAIWSDLDSELIAKGYKSIPVPRRDLAAELDQVKIRLADLETK